MECKLWGVYFCFTNIAILNDRILGFNQCLTVSFFPVLSTNVITEAYEVGDSRYAYIFFTIVAL